jgi:hypothetical protein
LDKKGERRKVRGRGRIQKEKGKPYLFLSLE